MSKIEFMENGEGDFKTSIKKEDINKIRIGLKLLYFIDEIDFHIAYYSDLEEIIFYNEECKEAYVEMIK